LAQIRPGLQNERKLQETLAGY